MKPSELREILRAAIPARLPVLVVSPPGVGKTSIAGQVAKEIGYDLVTSHPAVEDPTDSKGIPFGDGDGVDFRPVGQVKRVLAATRPTVWLVDDFGHAPPAVQAPYLQWLLARECAGHRLPDCVAMVLLTNDRMHRAGVNPIISPIQSRVVIVQLTPDLDEWGQWALNGGGVRPEVVAFIRFRADLLCSFNPTADLQNSPLPRTWANASCVLDLGLSAGVESEGLAGAVGAGAAAELLAFVRMYKELPSIEGILTDPDQGDIPTRPDTLYAVTTALGARANEKNFARIARYAERLEEAGHGEFATLLVRDSYRRNNAVAQTQEFIRLTASSLGQLMVGVG